MKKIFLCVSIFVGTILQTNAQTTFGFVDKYGFNTNNDFIYGLKSFKGKLYATCGNDSAFIYSSSTGDYGSFSRVYSQSGYFDAGAMEVSNEGSGYIFAAVNASNGGVARLNGNGDNVMFSPNSKVVRSVDGTTWDDYFQFPGSFQPGVMRATSINAFKGLGIVDSIYMTYKELTGGTFVVRGGVTDNDFINSDTWARVADFQALFGTTAEVRTSFVFNGKLYFSLTDNRLIETADGINYVENTNYSLAMGQLSVQNNACVTTMTSFGGELYLGTLNANGAQIWKTADGITFDSLYANSAYESYLNFKVASGKIWMHTTFYGDETVSSFDGVDFVVEEGTEFGNASNEAFGSSIEEFNNHLYVSTSNYSGGGKRLIGGNNNILNIQNGSGADLWRTCLVGAMPNVGVVGDGDTLVCNGATVNLTALPGMTSYIWNNGNTGSTYNSVAPEYVVVTGVAANTCRNSGEYQVNSIPSIPVYFTDSITGAVITNTVVCSGDSSGVFIAHPEMDYNALYVDGQNKGLITPLSSDFSARQITIELWVKPIDGTNSGQILTEYDTSANWSDNNHDLIEYYNGNIYVELPGMSETVIGYAPPGQWNHIVLRFDGSNLNGLINGVVGGGVSGTWANTYSGPDAFKLGYNVSTGLYGVPNNKIMQVRDLRIWNSVRSDVDIQNNMNGLTPGSYPDLIFHYLFDEGTGNIANDNSVYGHDTTVAGVFVVPQTVSIVPAAGLITTAQNHFKFVGTQSSNYKASYINSVGCAADSAVFDVIVPKIDFTGSTARVCGVINATINVNTAGSYTWTPGVDDYGTVVYPNPLPVSDTYYVANAFSQLGGCAMTDSILVKVGPDVISNLGNPPPMTACYNTTALIDADITGGTPPYTMYWTHDLITDTLHTDSIYAAVDTFPGVYYSLLTVDAIGCSLSMGFNIMADTSSAITGHVTTPPPASLNVDNGMVYLVMHHPGYTGIDTVGVSSLDANGNYVFPGADAGNYLIKVVPDSVAFPLGVPTYYGNAFQWDSSLVFVHGCAQTDTADIQILEVSTVTGIASISGYVLEDPVVGAFRFGNDGHNPNIPFAPGGPLKGIDVKLGKNPAGGIQARVFTDSTGFYEFDSVPAGGYRIYVDIPNLPMDSTRELIIAPTDSSIQNNYYVDSARVYVNPDTVSAVGIQVNNKIYENGFSIYPNPAKGNFYISYSLQETTDVSFEIANLVGQVIRTEPKRKYHEGKNIFIYNSDQLNMNSGVYFISIIAGNKKYTQRLVIMD